MLRTWLTLILFALFIIEGTVLPWIIPEVWQTEVFITPHLVFVVILYISLYLNRHMALAFGLGFGLLHDFIYYGPMIGPHSFNYGINGYLIGLANQRQQARLASSLFYIVLGNLMFECIHYGLYRMFGLVELSFRYVLLHQMIPSILFNLLFGLLMYMPFRKFIELILIRKESQESGS